MPSIVMQKGKEWTVEGSKVANDEEDECHAIALGSFDNARGWGDDSGSR